MLDVIDARLTCPRCSLYFNERTFHSECSNCGALLDLAVQTDARPADLRRVFAERLSAMTGIDRSGVWRFREIVMPTVAPGEIVSYPEGNTPLIDSAAVASYAGGTVSLKHEGMNPTGSFKDRGMTAAITQARRLGASAVACASTGNTSASLAAYAAMAGLPGLVLIPAGKIATGKLAQTLAHGARTIAVRGSFDDCLRLLREASDKLGVYVVNSVNPFRLGGQRTIVFEMLQQLGWQSPDWIALPAGNLGNTSAFGEALRFAKQAGLIDKVPRLLAVQASGAAPFAQAFRENTRRPVTVEPETIATAIRIGAPASWDRALRAIEETDGMVTDVSDEDILAAKRAIDRAGIGCEPASAASVAGVRKMIAEGRIRPDQRVVAVLTGHVLKDPGIIVEHAGPVAVIDPLISELSLALSR